ncbi:sodium/glutamate symporter [Pseudonocardia humida]|uniref:Sodium:glutamate symporter n=1 Tax=Pseudonocardia humida TaxID=2800819 RepID=A0ABT1A690_9PSEU|nr:sodium/glutamate symporter [Pseudonocardia humida]MCO1658515.1 sodium:glutamate symporter [Pseudonocardia humida]
MQFTVWSVLTDLGIICALLLLAQVLRAWVRPLQAALLPASILAGFLGLLLGPNALDLLPFSEQLSAYPGVLIVLIMTAVPIGQALRPRRMARRVGALYSYSQAGVVLMWGLGLAFGLAVLGLFWDLNDGFGLLLALGWAGGFGTAAAAGSAFGQHGWAEATSLGYTAATVGVVVCVIGGLIATKWATRHRLTTDHAGLDELPPELRTGLLPEDKREPIGTATLSSNSLESLSLHLGLVLLPAAAAYHLNEWFADLWPGVSIPLFSIGFLLGLLLHVGLRVSRATRYVDRPTISTLTGTFSDLLVAFAITSIVPRVVADNLVPLTLLFAFGLVFCVLLLRYGAPLFFRDRWFERGIFTWGWMTGSVPTGIALLRIADSRNRSSTLEDFGLAYLGVVPVEILLISTAPIVVAAGFAWGLVGATLAFGVLTIVLARVLGWWSVPVEEERPVAVHEEAGR